MSLRDALLREGRDIAVEVNQRSLIDKILSRYSGESVVFRELLQNADDASSTEAKIIFQSLEPIDGFPSLKDVRMKSVTVKNNGHVFTDNDWTRLRKIAEGNPDEDKIGAFGVGFYSLFSLAEEPVVSSGTLVYLFHWRGGGDQLFVKEGKNPNMQTDVTEEGKPWTTFEIGLREPAPMPDVLPFCRFLANALAFTNSLRTISLYINDHCLCTLTKKLAPTRTVPSIPGLQMFSPSKIMTIKSVDVLPVQIDCKVMQWATYSPAPIAKAMSAPMNFTAKLFASFNTSSSSSQPQVQAAPIDKATVLSASLFLRMVSANVAVSIPSTLGKELERATKNPPPRNTLVQMLYSSKSEFDATHVDSTEGAKTVFAGLLSDLKVQGRVAIGFMTHQTTGCAASIGARFIPTVERESLDLQAAYVKDWNTELLSTAGTLSRFVYEDEMREVAQLWKRLPNDVALDSPQKNALIQQAIHAARFFTFTGSTPSSAVSATQEAAFYQADKNRQLTVITSEGPASSGKARMPNKELSTFIKTTPTISQEALDAAGSFFDELRSRNMISDITIDDIVQELSTRALPVPEMISALQWWIKLSFNRDYAPHMKTRFINSAMISLDTGTPQERIVPLNSIRYYLDPRLVPTDLPLPPDVLPYSTSKSLKTSDLLNVFEWKELPVTSEITFLLSPAMTASGQPETNMLMSPHFSEKVFVSLAKSFSNFSAPVQRDLGALLRDVPCLPTKHGLRAPSKSYFSNISSLNFEDLDTVQFPSGVVIKGNLEKLLAAAGLQRHVDLQIIFSRLFGSGSWSSYDLVKYLVSVQETLSADEVDKLRKTSWLPKEGQPEPEAGTKPVRFKASELFEPLQNFRGLQLPLLGWQGRWASSSREAAFLFLIGLQRKPSASTILTLASDPRDAEKRRQALAYFLSSYTSGGFSQWAPKDVDLAFIPCMLADGSTGLGKPQEVYSNQACSIMGFKVLHPSMAVEAPKFKLASDPNPIHLMQQLEKRPPPDRQNADPIFAYLASRINTFTAGDCSKLNGLPFIPAEKGTKGTEAHLAPNKCFFFSSETSAVFASVFSFVSYEGAAKSFLSACGVLDAPSPRQVAQMLIDEPSRFLALAGNAEAYLQIIMQIATTAHSLPTSLLQSMRRRPFFLTTRRAPRSDKLSLEDDDEDEDDSSPALVQLTAPVNTVVIDDITLGRLFCEVEASPQEDLLEVFVEKLGAVRISTLVKTTYKAAGAARPSTSRSEAVSKLVKERAQLFLHERETVTRNEVLKSADWIKNNLRVVEVPGLSINQTIGFASLHKTVSRQTSAAASMDRGSLVLSINGSIPETDWFEVSAVLCRNILAKQRINDALLLMTLLSTDLQTLKRRGFAVNRILNARKAEREAKAEGVRQQQHQEELQRLQEREMAAAMPPQQDALLPSSSQNTEAQSQATSEPTEEKRPGALFSNLRKKWGNSGNSRPPSAALPSPAPASDQSRAPLPTQSKTPLTNSSGDATPLTDIRQNVLRAIQASRPDQAESIRNNADIRKVKESEGSYCDSSAATDLLFVASIAGFRFYCSKDVQSSEKVIMEYADALRRFCTLIVAPLGKVFNLDPKAIHVFYDLVGPLIAFNRNGSLFLNLRYYLSWHDAGVQSGNLEDALLSNYFSLAHEIAHNVVADHGSEHEFWSSNIAEGCFLKMAHYLATLEQQKQKLVDV